MANQMASILGSVTIRLNNDVVYPLAKQASDSFMARGNVPFAPIPTDTQIKVEAGDLILLAIPPKPNQVSMVGMEKSHLYGSLMHHGPIESADDMEQQVGSLVLHYGPLRGHSILAINVDEDGKATSNEIKEVIVTTRMLITPTVDMQQNIMYAIIPSIILLSTFGFAIVYEIKSLIYAIIGIIALINAFLNYGPNIFRE